MEHVSTGSSFAALAYLVAGVCFILALRGLSSPTSSQRGNRFGMTGMTIAVVTTLVTHVPELHTADSVHFPVFDWITILELVAAIGIGAVIGIVTAKQIGRASCRERV